MPADTIIALLATTLLATGWALWLLPVGTCAECPHCRAEKLAHERADEARAGRLYGIPLCPACGRHHARGEKHRT
ncbi:MAG: hypothetical protein E6I65_07940 [Chloroflexi bacterium]|nr:MAG: hypothetical protein E6I65_07940 [Chloroflexota bacterium]